MSNKKNIDTSFEEKINKFVDDSINWFKGLISGKNANDRILNVFLTIIVMFLLLWLLKIPFIILSSMGKGLIIFTFSPLDKVLLVLWEILIQLAYLAFAIFIIITIFRKIIGENKVPKVSKSKKTTKEEKTTEVKKTLDDDHTYISYTLKIILKIIVALLIIPFVIFNIGLFIALGVLVGLWMKGTVLVGAMFIIIGIFLIVGAIMGMMLRLISEGEGGK